jgi:putative nucleotidyltransferase with HDIG domain
MMEAVKRRILFVDDEPHVLQGLRRILRPLRHEWDTEFVDTGPKALETLARREFDVVVTDMRMPGMDGVELLREVMKKYPHIVRIVLSGHSDRETILQSIWLTHQFLAKPCDAGTLKSTVSRALALREFLSDEKHQRLVSRLRTLPALPSHFAEMMGELLSAEASLEKIGKIISKDVGMSAKILQLVNSAFFGLSRQVTNPRQAACLLGIDTIKALFLSVHVFSQYRQRDIKGIRLHEMWRHSMAVGAFARIICQEEKLDMKTVDVAFMAGMLHDIGKLVLALNLPVPYSEVPGISEENNIPFWQAEQKFLGASHASIGAYLLGLWGLPDSIVEAIAFHHTPRLCAANGRGPLMAVHVANILEKERTPSRASSESEEWDKEYLDAAGVLERIEEWRRRCYSSASEVDLL